ncbi:hypothetical protein ACLK19_16385 [Escherichia coli]
MDQRLRVLLFYRPRRMGADLIAFLLMGRESGSLDFASFRTLSLSPGLAWAVFLLAFFGFGAKAG